MRRIQECLETGSRSHLPAFFLVPLVSLSYAVCQWRTVLATIFSHTPNSKYEFDDEKDIKTEVRLPLFHGECNDGLTAEFSLINYKPFPKICVTLPISLGL